jgi:hypothetical protein
MVAKKANNKHKISAYFSHEKQGPYLLIQKKTGGSAEN